LLSRGQRLARHGHEQFDFVIGVIEAYRHATKEIRRFSGPKRREALETAKLCEAMLIEHLMENCANSARI
jgi:hypothetical protein